MQTNEERIQDLVQSFVEVNIESSDDFLKVKETLTRMGVANHRDKTLYQSCHILHKRGRYYIVHFKELFALDGRKSTISDEDIQRRNTISNLLEEWGMLDIINGDTTDVLEDRRQMTVISYRDKKSWELKPKYSIGGKQ